MVPRRGRVRGALALAACTLGIAAGSDEPSTLEIPAYSFDLGGDHVIEWEAILKDMLALRTAWPFAEAFGQLLGSVRQANPGVVAAFLRDLPRWTAALPEEERTAAEVLGRVLRQRAPQDGLEGDERLSDESVLLNQLLMPIMEAMPVLRGPLGKTAGTTAPTGRGPWDEDAGGGCTSILVAEAGTGRVLLGRNHDFEARTALANTTALVSFERAGLLQYLCTVQLPWITKLATCVRPGGFAMALNARIQGADSERGTPPEVLLRRLEMGALRRQTLLRRVMEADNYGSALSLAATLPSLDSMYIILAGAGPYQGAVVTRFGNSSRSDVWPLSPLVEFPEDGPQQHWFRVQANVDHWTPTGPYATHRRDHAIALVSAAGQATASTAKGLLSVLRNRTATFAWRPSSGAGEDTGAVLRPDTVLTALLWPAEGKLVYRVWASDPQIDGWQPPISAEVPTAMV